MDNKDNNRRRMKYFKPIRKRRKLRFDYFVSSKLDVLLFKFAKKFIAKI